MVRKNIISILLLFNLCTTVHSQIIKGSILDQNTHTRIVFASVYFNGTFAGTHTDRNGYFELDISSFKSMPLTISALGYYSITLTGLQSEKPFLIFLEPKIYELNEVVIRAKASSHERRTYLNIFKREFLGATMNALSCRITNVDDIILTYDPESDTLRAFSSKPILIHNKALGYDIIYYLDKFEYCWFSSYMLIRGNYIFKEDSVRRAPRQKRFERRRKSAFLGSRMHFIRSLWENNLDSAGFEVKDSVNVKLTYDQLVNQPDTIIGSYPVKYFKYRGTMSLAYHSKLPQSRIRILKENVYFDQNGYFDPLGIGWQGDIARLRTADLLPFEYKPEPNN